MVKRKRKNYEGRKRLGPRKSASGMRSRKEIMGRVGLCLYSYSEVPTPVSRHMLLGDSGCTTYHPYTVPASPGATSFSSQGTLSQSSIQNPVADSRTGD